MYGLPFFELMLLCILLAYLDSIGLNAAAAYDLRTAVTVDDAYKVVMEEVWHVAGQLMDIGRSLTYKHVVELTTGVLHFGCIKDLHAFASL